MNFIQAIILGIIEGLTEFLPISSTGHLIVAQKILGIENVNQFFTVIIQLGAIFASVYFFRDRVFKIAKGFFSLKDKNFKLKHASPNELLSIWITVAIIPTLIVGFIFRKQIDQWENSTFIVAFTTLFFGIVFYYIERIASKIQSKKLDINGLSFFNILVMGLFQAVAIIPGVSRSGSTVAGGVSQNIRIKDSIEISFIMGIPVIFIASIYKFFSTISEASSEIIIMTIIGSVVAFIVGLYSIKLTLNILGEKGFKPFMIYRIFFALLIFFLLFIGFIR